MNFQTQSQQIEPFLWFDTQAEEAVSKYVSLFPNSKINSTTRHGKDSSGTEGTVMTIGFELNGIKFVALNGGPMFQFTEAVSFVIHCKDQSEVDKYWDALLEGGKVHACGWLKDKFGLTWQVIPDKFLELLKSEETSKVASMMQAMMKMQKLIESELVDAFNNG